MMQPRHRGSSTETIARRGMRLCWPMRAAQRLAAFDVQTATAEFSPRRQRGLTDHHRMHAVHVAGGTGNAAGIRLEARRGPFGRNEAELNTESPLGGSAHRPRLLVVRTGVGVTHAKNKAAQNIELIQTAIKAIKAVGAPRAATPPGGVVSDPKPTIGRGPAWAKSKDFLVWARIFCAPTGFSAALAAADDAKAQQIRCFWKGGVDERRYNLPCRSLRADRRRLRPMWCADRANPATWSTSPILRQGLRGGCSRRATQGLAQAAASSRNVPHLQRTCAAAKRAGAGIAVLLCRVPNRRHRGARCAAAFRSPQSVVSTRAARPLRSGAA